MKKIRIEDAVGTVLAHDITRIVPGKFKGVGFIKGHIVKKEDIPKLLELGKQFLYVLDLKEGEVHEDDAAIRIARAISGKNLDWTQPKEGKSNIVAHTKGLLKINVEGLLKINRLGDIIISTLKTNFSCEKETTVAATRIIPLTIDEDRIQDFERIAVKYNPILQVLPYRKMHVGIIITGSEIYNGLIQDESDHYVAAKIKHYGSEVVKKIYVLDDATKISQAIRELKDIGCDLIITTGGLSVDPDDVTRLGVKASGAEVISYGSPILPGAMFLYALFESTPVIGLPACVYYYPTTVYDIFLPRILAGEVISRDDIAELGHGGLCMNCKTCHYPVCPFGK
ncbi:MAG TPA: molybdopterin-binding protein [Desulfobacteraceae bacterium]|nr:molybdopterin-binding protein [Desulfobacteraceae bacterium]